MSIEYDMSKCPRSRGAQCGVLLDGKSRAIEIPRVGSNRE